MNPRANPRSRVRTATAAVLPSGLAVAVEPRPACNLPLFDVTVETAGARHRFTAGWAGEGWPADVERLLMLAPDVDVAYARRMSEGARTRLSDHLVGWVDEAGAASIALPSGLIVARHGRAVEPHPSTEDRWTPTMLAATEAVLAGTAPTVEAVEAAVGMSRGASANALARLEGRGLLARPGPQRGRGVSRRIVDIDALVDEYATAAAGLRAKQSAVLVHRLWSDPLETVATEIGPSLSSEGATWAVTGAAGSTLLAPYLGEITVVELYVDRDLFASPDRLGALLGGRVVEKGHRIEVRELPTPMSAKGPVVAGIQVALPARVYADLMAQGGRFAEAGHHLREVRGVGRAT